MPRRRRTERPVSIFFLALDMTSEWQFEITYGERDAWDSSPNLKNSGFFVRTTIIHATNVSKRIDFVYGKLACLRAKTS